MSYKPLSPWKTEKTGSSRDRLYELQSAPDLDTPFVPVEAFPCYVPVVCPDPLDEIAEPPFNLVDDFGNNLVDDLGDPIVTD